MGKTKAWLLRGAAVAVFAALVGAWSVGLVDLGDKPASTEKPAVPVPPDSDPASHGQRSNVLDRAKPRRTRETRVTPVALTEPSPTSTDDPTDAAPGTPSPTSTAPDPDPSDPSDEPPSSTPPPQTPNNPPSSPANECTDLASVVDCALDPITGRP